MASGKNGDAATLVHMSLDDIIKSKPKSNARGAAAVRKSPGGKRGRGAGKTTVTTRKSTAVTQRATRGGRTAAVANGGGESSTHRWQHDKFEGSVRGRGARGASAATTTVRGRGRVGAMATQTALTTRATPIRRATVATTISPTAARSPILTRNIPATGLTTGVKVTVANLPNTVVIEDLQELFGGEGVKLKSAKIVSDGVAEIVFSRREDAVAAVSKYDNVLLDGRAMILKMAPGTAAPATSAARPVRATPSSRIFQSAMQL